MEEYQTATVHVGPKGGVEYRLWKTPGGDIFRVVSKYQAKKFLSTEEAEKAQAMESERKAIRKKKAEMNQILRSIGATRM